MSMKKKAPASAAKKNPTGLPAKKKAPPAAPQKLPTYKGTAGLPTLVSKSTALALAPPMSKAALDARQSNIGVRRKAGGPPKPEGGTAMASALEKAPNVAPTNSTEPPKRDKR